MIRTYDICAPLGTLTPLELPFFPPPSLFHSSFLVRLLLLPSHYKSVHNSNGMEKHENIVLCVNFFVLRACVFCHPLMTTTCPFCSQINLFFPPYVCAASGRFELFFQLFIAFVRLTCFDCFNCVFCRLTLSALTELKLFLRSTFYSFHFFPLFQFSSPSINCRCCCCCCRHARKELEMTFDGISFTLLYPSSAY